ncbi:hypothetical protein O0I10_005904 [Lichtheimia ornata]|uniref:PH domain-containing protein n=1 Tax=Lichtheimia ornata TaxID=688661 RepID=A0AAD7Y178_9FUNG|nr:uncharacterized protein O0I10_005904 [Lichtheimia ornata]KAJ8658222.1 hypothetical protein O0I10_005904 [Lichtheimia ornata]
MSLIVVPPPRSSSLRRPRAGWMTKMMLPCRGIGSTKTRWHRRFFVLLDTELRCYRNEHIETPTYVINLEEMCQVVTLTSSSSRPYCFRLEPIIKQGNRPLTLACESSEEMASWVEAIRSRLLPSPSNSPIYTKSISTFDSNKRQASLTRRRGVLLSPIMVHPLDDMPGLWDVVRPGDYAAAPSSPSILSSPTTITLAQPSPPVLLTPCNKHESPTIFTYRQHKKQPSSGFLVPPPPPRSPSAVSCSSPYSPTFIEYKERFNL